MRYGLITDIHSNLPAFEAVLECINKEGVDGFICAGDIVGYGPYPNECIELLQKLKGLSVVVGNHDWAALGLEDIATFNPVAQEAILWTKEKLTKENQEYLRSLPYSLTKDNWTLVHGTLRDPLDEYMIDSEIFSQHLLRQTTPFCFHGHTHIPFYFCATTEGITGGELAPAMELNSGYQYAINLGSVGQPRDSNSQAGYGIFDDEKGLLQFRRVNYDVKKVQQEMAAQRLPEYLIKRLEFGI